MKVFITGATGVLGRRVIRRLVKQDISVVALARSPQNTEFLSTEKVDAIQADLFNSDEMIKATAGCDAILHLATHIPKKTMPKLADWKMNDKIRTEGTKNLIDAAIKNGIRIFLCESITALYGQQQGGFVSTETQLPEQQVEMVKSAIQMEKMIRENLSGQFIIFRFGSFYSEDDFYTNNLISNVSKGRMPLLGKGEFYLNWIHIEDAASAIVFGLNRFTSLKGTTVNVTDGHPVLYADMLRKLSELTTNKSPFHLPLFVARWILGKNNLAFLTNSYRVKDEPLLRGWQPQYSDFSTGITEIVNQKTAADKPL